MKTHKIAFLLIGIIIAFLGCKTKETILEPTSIGDPFEVPMWNYATNHFFVDTLYIPYYNQLQRIPPTLTHPEYRIEWIQVWKLDNSIIPNINDVRANAFITLSSIDSNSYKSMRTQVNNVPGIVESGLFVPLDYSEYSFDANAGTLAILDQTITDQQSIAVSYKRVDGKQFGETLSINDSLPMILKLVKPRYLNNSYMVAWKLLMKNIYYIGKSEIAHTGFSLDVFRDVPNVSQNNSILNISLLKILGLDRFHDEGAPGSDGVFDFIPGSTIDKLHGEIIFPCVRPFDDGILEYFNSIGQPLPSNSEYLVPALYDTTRLSVMNSGKPSYVIKGRAVN